MPDGGAASSRRLALHLTLRFAGLPKEFRHHRGADHSFYGHFSVEELKEAWRKKAAEVAKGRKFKISSLVVHDNETDIGGWPTKSRSVSGTIRLID